VTYDEFNTIKVPLFLQRYVAVSRKEKNALGKNYSSDMKLILSLTGCGLSSRNGIIIMQK
jgi:hypothetical protein